MANAAVLLTLLLAGPPAETDRLDRALAAAEAKVACRAKEKPAACAGRLRELLRTQLEARPPAPLVPGETCLGSDALPACLATYGACTPVAAVTVEALGKLGRDAAAALPELRTAEERSPALLPFALRARAAAGDPSVLPRVREQLGQRECAREAVGLAVLLRTPEAFALLEQVARTGRPWARPFAALGLGQPDPAAADALLRLVGEPLPPWVLFGVAAGLAAQGKRAEPALPRLKELALTHWSRDVRVIAAKAVSKLTGKPFEGKAVECPAKAALALGEGAVRWSAPQHEASCGGAPGAFSARVDGECAAARLEEAQDPMGARAWLTLGKQTFELDDGLPPLGVLHAGARWLLFTGRPGPHSAGAVWALTRGASGWALAPLTELPGAPRLARVESDGAVTLVVDDGSLLPGLQGPGAALFDTGPRCREGLKVLLGAGGLVEAPK